MSDDPPKTLRTSADCIRAIAHTLACLDELSHDLSEEEAYTLRLAAAHLELARDLLDDPQTPKP